jgi:PPOX class probable F420-dependent enzyme
MACMLLAALAALASHAAPQAARAEGVDSARAKTIAVGPPRGAMPLERGDAARSGRASGLPAEVSLLFRAQLQGGLDFPVAVGASEVIGATASGHLLTLDFNGKELARAVLPAPAVASPVLTSAGARVVVVASGECVSYDAAGTPRFRAALPARGAALGTAPLPLPGGGVAVAAGASLLVLTAAGRVAARTRLPAPAAYSLLWDGSAVLATSESGRIFRWASPGEPRELGSFGGPLSSPAALSGKLLVAVVARHRLVTFDLAAGSPGASYASLAPLEGPVALGPASEAWLPSLSGLLLSIGTDGRELERIALQAAVSPGGVGAGSDGALPPPVLVAPDGRVAFVRTSGEVGILTRGSVKLSEQRACAEPIGIAADEARIWVSCRDGTVAAFGVPPRAAAPPLRTSAHQYARGRRCADQAPLRQCAAAPPRRSPTMAAIPEKYQDLLSTETKGFANLSTIQPDGSPQVTPVWFDMVGETIRVNTAAGRVKHRNMTANPNVAIAISDPANPYRYIQIRGKVSKVTEEGADEHIDSLAMKYMGKDKYPFRNPAEKRVIFEIEALSVQAMG